MGKNSSHNKVVSIFNSKFAWAHLFFSSDINKWMNSKENASHPTQDHICSFSSDGCGLFSTIYFVYIISNIETPMLPFSAKSYEPRCEKIGLRGF